MRLLAFSDLHCDRRKAAGLVEIAADADLVVCAGDLSMFHGGLEETVDVLRAIDRPVVLVPGNHETDAELRAACEGWPAATVLHGERAEVGGITFFGLGGAVPPTPFDWSFDLEEDDAADALAACPEGAALVVHSPPRGHLDEMDGESAGSESVLRTIEEKRPPVAVCGHIHECAGREAKIGSTRLLNLGPEGTLIDL